jgi:hypothetical protein
MLADLTTNETLVLVALIGVVPGILSAIFAGLVHRAIRTPSGRPIGRQVEDAHHTAIANNQRLVAVSEKVGAVTSALGISEEAHVEKLADENGAA